MEGKPPPLARAVLLGVTLLVLGGLLYGWVRATPDLEAPATVSVRVIAPEGDQLFFADPITLAKEDATVLGALLEGARIANMTVETQDSGPLGTMVVAIGQYRNSGMCGWLWEVNGALGDRAADRRALVDGDIVQWRWGCEG